MKIGIILAFKESMQVMEDVGQTDRFLRYYVKEYSNSFDKVYVFSWKNEKYDFPFENVVLIPNPGWNVYLYNFVLPFLHAATLKACSVLRLMQYTAILPAAITKLRYNIPIVATYGFPYGDFLRVKTRYVKSVLWETVERLTRSSVDYFIVTYPGTVSYLKTHGVSQKKFVHIPNGTDTSLFTPQEKKYKSTEVLRLLFIGRFSPEKNVVNLAKGIAQSHLKDKPSLTMVGDGLLKEDVEKVLRANSIAYRIIHHLPHTALPTIYRNADIFLLPSKAEGMPKVLLEAMSAGLPSIVGKYPGHESFAKDGYNALVCGHSPREIGGAIEMLAKDKALRLRLGYNAREYVSKSYDLPKLVKKEIALLHHVASQDC